MEYGLIGEKLGHSYSPQIHAQLAPYSYVLSPMPREQLHDFMTKADFKGINVTIPYKKDVLPYCSALSDDAREIGCVNTIVKRPDGTLYGHNTDIGGFMAMVRHAGISVEGKKAVILGSGGTCLTASIALRRMGAGEIVVISRSGENNYQSLYDHHADARVLVNTTPVGMYPNNGLSPADLSKLPYLDSVIDVIYNPEKTALILDAEKRGLKTVSGLYMLVSQARLAAEKFTGSSISPELDAKITFSIKQQMLNLVLVGMPGCGKTTIGKALAAKMNRPLIDTDEEIVKLAGKSIPDIFAQDGEARFRVLETQVIQEVSKAQGCIITTGGGAVLKEENRSALRQNSRVCHILRPLDMLARDGRPLSQGDNAVEKLWLQRKDLYAACAHYTLNNNTALESALLCAMEGFYEAACH